MADDIPRMVDDEWTAQDNWIARIYRQLFYQEDPPYLDDDGHYDPDAELERFLDWLAKNTQTR